MELLVLGIGIMGLGAVILHLAIEGRKAALAPVAATRKLPRLPLFSKAESEDEEQEFEPAEEFGKSDILLAEALTELLELKEQVTSLQARIDALTSAPKAARPATEPRHAVKHLRRRAAHGFA